MHKSEVDLLIDKTKKLKYPQIIMKAIIKNLQIIQCPFL